MTQQENARPNWPLPTSKTSFRNIREHQADLSDLCRQAEYSDDIGHDPQCYMSAKVGRRRGGELMGKAHWSSWSRFDLVILKIHLHDRHLQLQGESLQESRV